MKLSKTKFYWLLQIVSWSAFAFVQFLVLIYDAQPVDKMLVAAEGLQLVGNILLTHAFRFIIIRYKWLNFKLIKLIPLVMFGVIVLSIANAFLWVLILLFQNGTAILELSEMALIQPFVAAILESVFVFSFWSFAYFIYLYIERYNKSLQYEAAVRETELNNLKAQLNPHFIFNSLNSIRALVGENPEKSKAAITQLSNILRNSLNSDRQKLVPFSEELKTVVDYLGLESIRYEERLKTEIDLADGSKNFQVPPLMLQTLVENGIKHGIAKLQDGGEVRISTRIEEENLYVEIRNTGQLDRNWKSKKGFGLKSTIKRLDMIYGEDSEFIIRNENKDTVLTKIKIPK